MLLLLLFVAGCSLGHKTKGAPNANNDKMATPAAEVAKCWHRWPTDNVEKWKNKSRHHTIHPKISQTTILLHPSPSGCPFWVALLAIVARPKGGRRRSVAIFLFCASCF